MKHDWKKNEKQFYLPKEKPERCSKNTARKAENRIEV